GGHLTDPPGEGFIAFGDGAGVVARGGHQDVREAQQHVRVVVQLLGDRGDLADQLGALCEGTGLETGLQGAQDRAPVGQVLSGGGFLIVGGHRRRLIPRWWSVRPSFDCPGRVAIHRVIFRVGWPAAAGRTRWTRRTRRAVRSSSGTPPGRLRSPESSRRGGSTGPLPRRCAWRTRRSPRWAPRWCGRK